MPEEFQGVVIAQAGTRRGVLTKMVNRQRARAAGVPDSGARAHRIPLAVPHRHQGTGIMNHLFAGWEPWHGAIAARSTGALVADRTGVATAYAIYNLQERGEIFVDPGVTVYGDDHRRERTAQRHGCERHEGKETDEHARLDCR